MAKLTRFSSVKVSGLLPVSFAALALVFACTDDGGEGGEGAEGSETAASNSNGDGDGDGDGDATDSAEGDSDSDSVTASGDGDGDPATGDGDGDDTASGDGDGDDTASGDGDGDDTASGDGDGDDTASGDGDGDMTGDGDGDMTGDGDGDMTGDGDGDDDPPLPPDADDDGIPDPDDPFPMDADLPGQATANLVYAHTNSALFTMDPFNYNIAQVGGFSFDQSNGSVTDIAIDRWGVLYAVTFNDIFVCDPTSADCYYLGDLPSSFNGLTMVPPGTISDTDDTLIGIANDGRWFEITVQNEQAQLNQIGQYGMNMTSSGDAFSIQGTGTFGSVNKPGVNNGNVIVESDPTTGMVLDELATAVGYTSLWGMAGWQGRIFGFNSGGEVIEIDPNGGNVVEVVNSNNSWWGAGVYSVLPQ